MFRWQLRVEKDVLRLYTRKKEPILAKSKHATFLKKSLSHISASYEVIKVLAIFLYLLQKILNWMTNVWIFFEVVSEFVFWPRFQRRQSKHKKFKKKKNRNLEFSVFFLNYSEFDSIRFVFDTNRGTPYLCLFTLKTKRKLTTKINF